MKVGDRVTHVDRFKQDGSVLPMQGTVVGVKIEYLVEWDSEEQRPISGWTPTHYYSAEALRQLEADSADPPLMKWAERIERDRSEPDKIFAYAQSMRAEGLRS